MSSQFREDMLLVPSRPAGGSQSQDWKPSLPSPPNLCSFSCTWELREELPALIFGLGFPSHSSDREEVSWVHQGHSVKNVEMWALTSAFLISPSCWAVFQHGMSGLARPLRVTGLSSESGSPVVSPERTKVTVCGRSPCKVQIQFPLGWRTPDVFMRH